MHRSRDTCHHKRESADRSMRGRHKANNVISGQFPHRSKEMPTVLHHACWVCRCEPLVGTEQCRCILSGSAAAATKQEVGLMPRAGIVAPQDAKQEADLTATTAVHSLFTRVAWLMASDVVEKTRNRFRLSKAAVKEAHDGIRWSLMGTGKRYSKASLVVPRIQIVRVCENEVGAYALM
jgi:hypothetical protein